MPLIGNNLNFLKPYASGNETIALPSGKKAVIKRYFITFQPWQGKPISNTYNNKAVINFHGEPVFAELAVLRLFRSNGWNGVWVDKSKYRIGLLDAPDVNLPPRQEKIIETIRRKTASPGGCWDVFAWKNNKIVFMELKRSKKDLLRDSQKKWLAAALDLGFRPDDFALVEWNLEENSRK